LFKSLPGHITFNMNQSVTEHKGVQFFTVESGVEGQRLDNFLVSRLKGVPKSRIYRLIRKGEIRVNKKRCKPDRKLVQGDSVRVAPLRMSEKVPPPLVTEGLEALIRDSILYEDDSLLVINKPAGLAVHAGTGVRLGLIEALRQIYPQLQDVELVHRLDKDTSGCLLVARTPAVLKTLQDALRQRTVEKVYLALVQGEWPEEITEVRAALQRDELRGGERVVSVDPRGKAAVTRYCVLERLRDATLIEARPVSGRTHQIRVHCRHAGHPILGDNKYLDTAKNRFPQIRHLCLHAASISFELPDETGNVQKMAFSAPMNSKMADYVEKLRVSGI